MIDRKQVRSCFKRWQQAGQLGDLPLAGLPFVSVHAQTQAYADSAVGRGMALRDLLEHVVEQLDSDSRAQIILNEQFINGRSPTYVAEQLHVSKRTYHREQAQALDFVVDQLKQMAARAAESKPPAARQAPFLAPPPINRPFIGRKPLLTQITNQLLTNTQPRIALHGLPGVGKTSLLIELAHSLSVRTHFADGVLWTSLGQQPDLLNSLAQWASTLGATAEQVAKASAIPDRVKLVHQLCGNRKLLLLIDDAWTLDAALTLQLGGPNCVQLLSTRFPDIAHDFAGDGMLTVDEFSQAESATLLTALTDVSEDEQLRELSQLVGGLPLALTLVGRYLRRSGQDGMAELLNSAETRLQLSRPQSPLRKQASLPFGTPQSLYNTIELSFNLLPPAAQQTLVDLTLLPPKPNAVAQDVTLALNDNNLDACLALADAGLLSEIEPLRYTMHQTIFDYASQHERSDEAGARLVDFFGRFAARNAQDYTTLDATFANIVAACNRAAAGGMIEALLAMMRHLSTFAKAQGRQHALIASLQQAQSHASADKQPQIAYWLGRFALERGELESAESYLHQSVQQSNTTWFGDAALEFSQALFQLGKTDDAIKWNEQALVAYYQQEEAAAIVAATGQLALMLGQAGRYEEVEKLLTNATTLAQGSGDISAERSALSTLAVHYWRIGNFSDARALNRRCILLCQQLDDPRTGGNEIMNLVSVLEKERFFADAPALYARAIELARKTGNRITELFVLSNLGMTVATMGQFEQAFAHLQQGNAIARAIGHRRGEASTLIQSARANFFAGNVEKAVEVGKEALAIANEIQEHYYINETELLLGHIERELAHFDEAFGYYQRAITGLSDTVSLGQQLDARCGLALTQLRLGIRLPAVGDLIEEVCSLPLGELQPRTYLTARQICQLACDLHTQTVAQLGVDALMLSLSNIEDEATRHTFLDRVWIHRQLLTPLTEESRA